MSSVENDRDTLDSPVPGEAVLLSESMQGNLYNLFLKWEAHKFNVTVGTHALRVSIIYCI